MGTLEVIYRCTSCNEIVKPGDGYLHISQEDISMHSLLIGEWAKDLVENSETYELPMSEHPSVFGHQVRFTVVQPSEAPMPPLWKVHHLRCDPDNEGNDIVFPLEQLATWPDLTKFVAYVQEQPWVDHTNLYELIDRLSKEAERSTANN